jgi:dihydrofolate reductase
VGKIVATEFVSLDGVFEDPGGSEGSANGAWTFKFDRGEEGTRFKLKELTDADAQLLGRVTYQGFAKAWPTVKDEAGFADKMNNMPKLVVSSTLKSADWNNSQVIAYDPAKIAAIKDEYARDILIAGSGTLVRALIQDGLLDRLNLMVFPVALGKGRRLFDGVSLAKFKLDELTPVGPDGVFFSTYSFLN